MLVTYFSTIGGVAALNVALTELINTTFKVSASWLKQLISWICPMLLCIIGFVFGFGFFTSYGTITSVAGWIYTILTGLGLGLTSNGIYDIQWVQTLIENIKEIISNTKINK